MEANEAPEKIILSADRDTKIIYDEWVIKDLTDNIKIEYTRTDAFIEKAAQWLKENLLNHTYVYEGEVGIGMAVFLEDFKNYMKGE